MKKPTRAGLEVAVSSEKGLRDENQDWLSWTQLPGGELFIVADGMGGYKGGVRAARMTVDGIERCLTDVPPDLPFEQALQDAVSRTNAEVHRAAHCGDPETENMGSTVVVALVADGRVQVGHVGDSRAYLYRRGKLQLLTHDHTRVQQMLDAGMLTPEQARTHPESHVLSRAVGSRPDVEVELGSPVPLEEGDALLLCSDGLSGYVTDEQISKALAGQKRVQEVPTELVKLAMAAGGTDNVTVQFVRVGKRPRQSAAIAPTDSRVTARLPVLLTLRVSQNARRAARNAAMSASLVLVTIVGAGLWLYRDGAAGSAPAPPGPASAATPQATTPPKTPATPPAAAAPANAGAAVPPPAAAPGVNASTPAITSPAADTSGARAATPASGPAPTASQAKPSVGGNPVKPATPAPPRATPAGSTSSQRSTPPKNGASATTTKPAAPAKKTEPAQEKPRANQSPAAPKPPATPAGKPTDAAAPPAPEEKKPEKKPETKPGDEEQKDDRENKPPADEPRPEYKP